MKPRRPEKNELDQLLESSDLDSPEVRQALDAIERNVEKGTYGELPRVLQSHIYDQACDFFDEKEALDAAQMTSAQPNVDQRRDSSVDFFNQTSSDDPKLRQASAKSKFATSIAFVTAICALIFALFVWQESSKRVEESRNDLAASEATIEDLRKAINKSMVEEDLQSRSPAQLRTAFLKENKEQFVRVAWTNNKEFTEFNDIAGDVVWSDTEQKGFMHFHGLPINDPSREQYQLWIFDENRDDALPVDGGVFDITEVDTVISINAKLPITKAKLFAVTIEKPGGTVKSDRKRLPVLASP